MVLQADNVENLLDFADIWGKEVSYLGLSFSAHKPRVIVLNDETNTASVMIERELAHHS